MSDTSNNFGFGKFVPGFDFLQSLAKGASSSIPQLPNLSNWVAPTISVEELEKRIEELKAVQFWLEQNSRALAATIQALEVQKMTLATLKGMNFSMGDVANAFKLKTADTVMSGVQKAADTVSGAAEAVAGAAARVTGRAAAEEETPDETEAEPAPAAQAKPKAKGKTAAAAEPAVVDPMQWWGALTSQFQQIAANAMKDAAKQTAIDTTKNMATGLAKEALKTATGMASQFAAKGMQTMQGGAKRAAASSAGAAKKTAAAKKPAARKTTTKPAAKKASSTRSPAARKRAG
ncbi:PhaM family polyhydroxyalkanoate granule multifunctional regulatory protein [Acidovorax sp. ST3]|uniref:PhaM family polyhydroxyalkanoate granule multifunctional regulatory protein n=1 Tax=Acidovorax sp. ST3 TaxID=2219062 RepID=UPI000DA6A6B8|nr:PhaM family polyhydroxyalkanoate granule multifunctional regulatory protein [Acidovorax sp. ST3]